MPKKMYIKAGDHFREYVGDGVVHEVSFKAGTNAVWSLCRKNAYDAPFEWSHIVPTDDPVDCVTCLAEGT